MINETCHSAIIEYMAECVPVEGDLPIYHTTQVVMTQPKAHFSSLYPSTVYRLSVKTRSLAGWSAYGNAFLHKTLSSVPEPPPKLEILKVTMNSLLAHWHPPYRNNGHPVNLYQLEVLDYKLAKAREDPTTLPYDPDSSNRGGVNIWINPSTTENDEVLPTRNLGNDASQSTQSAHGAIENDSYESPISRMIRSSHSRSRNRSRKNTPLLSEDSVSNQSILSAESEAVGHSMRHRLIRHRNIDYKFK